MKCRGCDNEIPVKSAHTKGRQPVWCSERCRKRQYQVPCERCGAPCGGIGTQGGGRPPARYCIRCAQRVTGDASAERARPRRELAEQLWADGKTYREMAPLLGMRLGSLKSQMTRWRIEGYCFPHRRPRQAAIVKRMHAAGRARPFGRAAA